MTTRSTTARCAASLVLLALLAPGAALAHPGHGGGFLPGLGHPFMGLDHLLAAIAVGMWGARIGGRAAWVLPAVFVTTMLLGAAAIQPGVELPATEIAIALSVACVGALLATGVRVPAGAAAAIVAVFALFHGFAHGGEAADAGAFAAYAFGLGLATAAIHAAGVAAAFAARTHAWIIRVAAAPVALAGAAMLAMRLA